MTDDFKTMQEMTQRVFKTAEDEEFERIEREQAEGWRKRQIESAKTAEEAFVLWDGVSHHPSQHELQKQAFKAGWDAAMRQRWSERND
jgi:hypothetical protein